MQIDDKTYIFIEILWVMKTEQLVLIKAVSAKDGKTIFIGSGYFITPGLILTSNHVFRTPVKKITAQIEESGEWLECKPQLVWNSLLLDAALISVNTNHPEVVTPLFDEEIPENT